MSGGGKFVWDLKRPAIVPPTRANKRPYPRCAVTPGEVAATEQNDAAALLRRRGGRDHGEIVGGRGAITVVIIAFCEASDVINASRAAGCHAGSWDVSYISFDVLATVFTV